MDNRLMINEFNFLDELDGYSFSIYNLKDDSYKYYDLSELLSQKVSDYFGKMEYSKEHFDFYKNVVFKSLEWCFIENKYYLEFEVEVNGVIDYSKYDLSKDDFKFLNNILNGLIKIVNN